MSWVWKMLLTISMPNKSKELFDKCVEGKKMLEILLEPMRQGRLFSPFAAKTESKYTSQTPDESKDLCSFTIGERGTLTWRLFVAFDRRPKVPEGNNKTWLKLFRLGNTKEPCVNTGKLRCRIKVTMAFFPVFEHNVNNYEMFCCFQREQSSNRRPKVTDATHKNANPR